MFVSIDARLPIDFNLLKSDEFLLMTAGLFELYLDNSLIRSYVCLLLTLNVLVQLM